MELNKEKLTWLVGGAVVLVAVFGIVVSLMLAPAAEGPPTPMIGESAAQSPGDATTAAEAVPTTPSDATSGPNTFALVENEVPQIQRKLKEIGLAFLNFHDTRKTFSARGPNNTAPQLSWRVYLLPFLDQMPLYRRFKLDEPWDSPHNLELIPYMPEIYRSGNDNGETTRFVVLTGEHALFRDDRPVNIRHCVDGTSNTILVAHSGGATGVPWTKPEDMPFNPEDPLAGIAPLVDNYELLMVDGAVLSLPSAAGPDVFAALATPRGGEIVDANGLRSGRIPTITGRKEPPPLPEYRPYQPRPEPVDPQQVAAEAARAILASVPLAPIVPAEYSFERPGFTFAYDQATGRLMAVEQERNQITIYDVDGGMKAIATLPAPARPISAAAKQLEGKSYFIVGGKLDNRIDVFDAKKLSSTGSVTAQTATVMDLSSSLAADDPYVYYRTLDDGGDNSEQSLVGRLDVAKLRDDGLLGNLSSDFEVSADGTILYVRDSGSYGLSAVRVVPRDPQSRTDERFAYGPMQLESVNHVRRNPETFATDPHAALMASGKELYSATLGERYGEFEFPVMAFLPRTPWVLGVTEGRLYVGSVNDRRTVLAVQLPADFVPPPPEDDRTLTHAEWELKRKVRPIHVFADADRGRIVVTTQDRAAVIDVKSLNLPDEPLLTMGLEGPKSFTIGKPAEFRMKSYDDRVTSRLVAAPVGMQRQGKAIAWTPSDVDIGDASLIVERRFDRFRFEQTFTLPVRREFVRLPMRAEFVSLSPDGKLAVVTRPHRDADSQPVRPNIALVETSTGNVLATQTVEKPFWNARVDATGVYVLTMPSRMAGSESTVDVMRLNLADLSLAATVDVTLGGIDLSHGLEPVANDVLLVGRDRFELPSMQRLPQTYSVYDGIMSSGMSSRAAYRVGDGWMFDGVLWEGNLARPVLVDRPAGFNGVDRIIATSQLTPWGRMISGNRILTGPDKPLLELDNYAQPVVSNVAPVALALNLSAVVNRRVAVAVDAFDLVKGREAWQIVLLRNNERSGSSLLDRGVSYRIDTAGEIIAACADGKLFLVPLAEIRPNVLPRPFRFKLAQSPILLKPAGLQSVAYELLDGEPPFDVTLSVGEYRLRESAEANVTLKLDGRKIAADLYDRLAGNNAYGDDPRDKLIEYIESVTPLFKKIVGRNPSGVPLVVPVTVEATDKQLRTARLNHALLVEWPMARYIEITTDSNARNENPYRDRTPPKLAETSAADERRQRKLAELNAEMAVDYANDLRAAHRSREIAPDQLQSQAVQGKKAADEMFAQAVEIARNERLSGLRAWADRKGHSTQAQLKSVFADEVVLLLPKGKEITVPIEKLSDADQAYIHETQEEKEANEGDHEIGRFQLLSDAFARHLRRERSYPPAFIVDEKNQPLLSWRVALLPDLGAEQLFALFHFDERWDSPHNRRLEPYMPAVFEVIGENPRFDTGGTPIMAFVTSDSVLAGGHPLSARDVKNPFGAALFGESRNRRTRWTSPNDLEEDVLRDQVGALRPRNDYCLVGLSNQTVRALPSKMNSDDLNRAISRHAQASPAPPYADPRLAFPAPEPGTPTDDPFHKQPERTDAEIQSDRFRRSVIVGRIDENSPVGTEALELGGEFPPEATFRIVDGTGRDTFEIDPATRMVKVKDNAQLDFERNRYLSLRLAVNTSDGQTLPERDLEIDLEDVDEPLVVGKQQPLEVLENAIKGAVIGKLAVRDPDMSQQFQATITAGNNHGAFEVDAERSRLVVANEGALRKLAGLGPRPLTIEFRDESGAEPVRLTVDVNVAKLPESEPKAQSAPEQEAKPEPAAKGE